MTNQIDQDARAQISRVLGLYFDALYTCDLALFAEVFHPKAHYVCATNDELIHYNMEKYFEVIKDREPPAKRNEIRHDKIQSVDLAGENLARAIVNCSIGNRLFTDYLTLIKVQDQWQIICKAFHYELI